MTSREIIFFEVDSTTKQVREIEPAYTGHGRFKQSATLFTTTDLYEQNPVIIKTVEGRDGPEIEFKFLRANKELWQFTARYLGPSLGMTLKSTQVLEFATPVYRRNNNANPQEVDRFYEYNRFLALSIEGQIYVYD